ncbi:GNAT family N-acetyltransferase [Fontivita pretiosa]|uniref:GNAT family N-acetyltransferase n=1 Tax=Fontivita pretiosa TaxID=2989684 RepID=UPI003D17A1D3
MQAIQHHNPPDFARRVQPTLLKRECENCVLLGLTGAWLASPSAPTTDTPPLLFTVESDDGQVKGVAIQTPPRAMLLSRLDGEGTHEPLARELKRINWSGPGLLGPLPEVDAVARRWSELSGQSRRQRRALRVFELSSVIAPQRPCEGLMVRATEAHLDLLEKWCDAFAREIGEPDPRPRLSAERMIRERRLFLWQDEQDRVLSMTAIAGPTPNGMRINYVYTPPEYRGRGCASSLVAAVSQHLLDSGRRFCFLFTDLANPAASRIYQRLGYRPVSDWRHWVFD